MTTKKALLFCLAILGVLFIGLESLLPVIGLGQFAGALYTVGGLLLLIFVALVLGFGFILKLFYLAATIGVVAYGANALVAQDWIMGAIFAAVSIVLIALIPKVFLSKK